MDKDQILDHLYKLEAALRQMCRTTVCRDCPVGGSVECHLTMVRNMIFDWGGNAR